MKKFLKSLLIGVSSIGLTLGLAVTPVSAAPSPGTIYVGGPAGSVSTCSAGAVALYSDSSHTTLVTAITGTTGTLNLVNDCSADAIYVTQGSSTNSIPGSLFDPANNRNLSSTNLSASGTLSVYLCARSGTNGSAGNCSNSGTRTLESTATITVTGGSSGGSNYSGPVGTPGSASVSTTGLVIGQPNPNPITVKMKVTTGNTAETVMINMPSGWTWVTPVAFQSPCVSTLPIDSYTGFTFNFCRASNGATILSQRTDASELYLRNLVGTTLAAGTEVTIVIKAGALNVGSGTDFVIGFGLGASPVDKATVSVGAGTSTATPAKGTAAALATIPKASKAPKLSFDSSSNGLGKSSKKSLKKVADIAKDGYGVRVTGAAGMQPGVSRDVVKALAKKRALEIRAYLIKQGVPKEDIVIKTKIFPIGKAPSTLVKVETLS